MRILIVHNSEIPVKLYGGIERVIWGLGKELYKLGHDVTFLVRKGSKCDFAKVLILDEKKTVAGQITKDYDVVHFNFIPDKVESLEIPYLITMHGNSNDLNNLDKNTVFISKNHADRYLAKCFVYNGLDWDDYPKPDLNKKRSYFHFLGKAAWRVKNVQGAIDIINKTKSEQLRVLGGVRFNFSMGIRFTFSQKIQFYGMVGGVKKFDLISGSKGLIFPVRWHEPFGLAIIESLYLGCPIFATPYGSIPELVTEEFGYLSNQKDKLAFEIMNAENYSKKQCHEYARDEFNSRKMTLGYLKLYEKVISGESLNLESPRLKEIQESKWLEWN
jgi:glycosyltransferase involved in cell wall biosynthesis